MFIDFLTVTSNYMQLRWVKIVEVLPDVYSKYDTGKII